MLNKTKVVLQMIKFEHTIFVLPFAFFGAVLATLETRGTLPTAAEIGWITMAMVGARSVAMGLNRLIDHHIDSLNPRTSGRALPQGQISRPFVVAFCLFSLLILIIASLNLHPITLYLLPAAVAWLTIYSYTKRFTSLCHLWLGIATGLGPLGAWVALTGTFSLTAWMLFLAVTCWVAGFDIIYACQDVDFDRAHNLCSIPARLGLGKALLISSCLHAITVLCLFLLLLLSPSLHLWTGIGIAVIAVLLCIEHIMVRADDLSRVNQAFFTINGLVSIALFLTVLVDVCL